MLVESRKILFFKLSLGMVICLFSVIALTGQTKDSPNGIAMKPEWKQYRVGKEQLSVSLPKFPTLNYRRHDCESFERFIYAAYENDIVYTVVITNAVRTNSSYCFKFSKFGRDTLTKRIDELAGQRKVQRDLGNTHQDNVTILKGDTYKIKIIDDVENKRFIEMWITSDPKRKVDEKAFFESFSFAPIAAAIDPKGGIVRTAGDDVIKPFDPALWMESDAEKLSSKYNIVHKPLASYTDAARQNNVQGTVKLKVTLLANGGIGTITPENSLKHGLTEQSIDAARRIVFLPEKVNGKNEDKIVTIEYSFKIY